MTLKWIFKDEKKYWRKRRRQEFQPPKKQCMKMLEGAYVQGKGKKESPLALNLGTEVEEAVPE